MKFSRPSLSSLLLLGSWGFTTVRCDDSWQTKTWDAIVVGGGTAGLIAGAKFSEAGLNTLVLELGGPSYYVTGGRERPSWLSGTSLSRVDVPGLYKSIYQGGSPLQCASDVVAAFQGCTVGGNSAINAGLYFQPTDADWDSIKVAGWGSSDMKDSTARLLGSQPASEQYSPDGKYYLQTGYEAARKWIVDGAGFKDVNINQHYNTKSNVFGRPQYNYHNGQRGGPATTYLQAAQARSNFHLQTGARVDWIIQNKGKATGVAVTVNGKRISVLVSSTGFVTLSAGALLSPKILMYSGIGPKDALTSLSNAQFTPYISSSSWIVNNYVGTQLFDNPNTFIELSDPSVQAYATSYDNPTPGSRDLYLKSHSGPYSFASQTSVFWGFIPQSDGTKTGVQGTIDSSGYQDFKNGNTITLNIYGTSGMKSTGHVKLSQDGKFTAGPSSDVYYSNDADATAIAQFIYNIFQKLPDSTPQSPAKSGLTPLNLPRRSSLADIKKYITTWSPYAMGQTNHWTSSCRIGKCVDANTKVVGTQNIYVVDASIVPPLTVNPQFGVMVAAQRASGLILSSRKA